MGTYYKAACDELSESIDPGEIDNLGIKANAIANPAHPLGPFIVYAMLNRWHGKKVRIVNDAGDDDGYFRYENVTEDVLEDYNKNYGTSYKFTGT